MCGGEEEEEGNTLGRIGKISSILNIYSKPIALAIGMGWRSLSVCDKGERLCAFVVLSCVGTKTHRHIVVRFPSNRSGRAQKLNSITQARPQCNILSPPPGSTGRNRRPKGYVLLIMTIINKQRKPLRRARSHVCQWATGGSLFFPGKGPRLDNLPHRHCPGSRDDCNRVLASPVPSCAVPSLNPSELNRPEQKVIHVA